MIINHNLSAMNARRHFSLNSSSMDVSLQKLSSGMRINRGMDDPAGLAVSEKMRAQIRGLNVASRNAQDGVSFLQTAEGWLSETTEILQRMRELSVQTANGIYTQEDRSQIQTEINQLVDEIDRIASQAEYNGMRILKGGFRNPDAAKNAAPATKGDGKNSAMRPIPTVDSSKAVNHDLVNEKGGVAIHIGANTDQREIIYIENVSAAALGLADGDGDNKKLTIDYSSQEGANKSIATIDGALHVVNRQRANLGAYQSRLEIASRGTDIAAENLQAAESRIRDTDMADEMVRYVKSRILTEASGSLLAQANLKPMIITRILDKM